MTTKSFEFESVFERKFWTTLRSLKQTKKAFWLLLLRRNQPEHALFVIIDVKWQSKQNLSVLSVANISFYAQHCLNTQKMFQVFCEDAWFVFFRIRGSHTVCTEWWQNEIACANAGKCATFILLTHICLFLHMYVCIFSIWLLFFYYCIKALERMWSKESSSIDCSIVLYLLCTSSVLFFLNMLQMISRECTDDITIAKLNVQYLLMIM